MSESDAINTADNTADKTGSATKAPASQRDLPAAVAINPEADRHIAEAMASVTAAITAPGQPYETTSALIRGSTFRVFANAPANLRELYAVADEFQQATAFVYLEERYTYADLWRQASAVAARLVSDGLAPGERVGIAMRNYPEWVFAFMGITAAGGTAVALNAWWTGEELLYGIQNSGLTRLFADGERLERLAAFSGEHDAQIISVRAAPMEAVTDWHNWLGEASEAPTALSPDSPDMPDREIHPDDNALILYTSGSTAHPKGVVTSHRAIIHALLGWECAAAIGAEVAVQLQPDAEPAAPVYPPAMILTVPLFHVAGLNVQLLSSFRTGRKLVAMYKWDPEEALAIVERERITHFNGVPTMSWEMVQSPNFSRFDTSSLLSMGGGGAAMAPQHARQISERLPGGVAGTGYGMTETSGLGTTIGGNALLARPRSCGTATPPMVTIKIVDDRGTTLPAGETGEIWIHGTQNFSEYWDNPKATQATLTDGWVHTGDIGHMDDAGYVFITDREKDMVIRGGENIGCQEVEAAIYEHHAVSECAVFGVPDERLGETVAAVIMLKPGAEADEDDIRAHVATLLARFKVPQHVWLRREQLPRIASGKIYKRGLRDEAIQAMGQK